MKVCLWKIFESFGCSLEIIVSLGWLFANLKLVTISSHIEFIKKVYLWSGTYPISFHTSNPSKYLGGTETPKLFPETPKYSENRELLRKLQRIWGFYHGVKIWRGNFYYLPTPPSLSSLSLELSPFGRFLPPTARIFQELHGKLNQAQGSSWCPWIWILLPHFWTPWYSHLYPSRSLNVGVPESFPSDRTTL